MLSVECLVLSVGVPACGVGFGVQEVWGSGGRTRAEDALWTPTQRYTSLSTQRIRRLNPMPEPIPIRLMHTRLRSSQRFPMYLETLPKSIEVKVDIKVTIDHSKVSLACIDLICSNGTHQVDAH